MATTKTLNWREPIKLRGGGEVRLYNAEGGGEKPVHGAYNTGTEWIPCAWTINGNYLYNNKKCGLDIINAEETTSLPKQV